jgi:hypothetical protein
MKFMMMIKHTEPAQPFQPPKTLMDAMGEFVTEGFAKGWLKETAGLKPTAKGTRIRSKGGKLTVTDGPFTEAKEVIGGFAIVETSTREEAMADFKAGWVRSEYCALTTLLGPWRSHCCRPFSNSLLRILG